jgi:hypothetical protein
MPALFPDWNWWSFDCQYAKHKFGPFVDATDPDLRPFRSSGGKPLMYGGWVDLVVSSYDNRRLRPPGDPGHLDQAGWQRRRCPVDGGIRPTIQASWDGPLRRRPRAERVRQGLTR